ncbi:terpene cyclase [Streptomyces clavuligerus]|nr:terpene cyclase [Streptomyces clavuligerus]
MVPEAVALAYPRLEGPGLDLVMDSVGLLAFFDDLIGSHPGPRDSLDALHARYAAVMAADDDVPGRRQAPEQEIPEEEISERRTPERRTPAERAPERDDGPLARAWRDIWARQTRGKAPWWVRRTRARWLDYLAAAVAETTAQWEGRPPDPAACAALRRRSVAIPLFLDLAEAGGGFEVVRPAVDSPLIRRMTELCTDIVSHVNDVASLHKEEAAGELHNIVLLLEHGQGLTRDQAVDEVGARVHAFHDAFRAARAEVPALCSALRLDERQRTDLLRYADAMTSLIRGNHDWSRITRRYSAGADAARPLDTVPARVSGEA